MKTIVAIITIFLLAGAAAGQDSTYLSACGTLNTSYLDCPRIVLFSEPMPLVTEIVAVNPSGFQNGDTVRFEGWFFPFQMHLLCVASNPAGTHTLTACSCCSGERGNVDCDPNDFIDVGDLTALLDYLFMNRQPLCCAAEADMVPDGNVDIDDLAALIRNLFISFEVLPSCQPTKAGAR